MTITRTSPRPYRPLKLKSYLRSWVAIGLLVTWFIVAVTGVLLWLAPDGRQSGQIELFMGLTKHEWGDIHWWVAVATVSITTIHLIIDWKALKGAMRYLVSVHREQVPGVQAG